MDKAMNSEAYPPHPRDSEYVVKMASVFGSAFAESSAVYVAAPITTGMQFLEWWDCEGKQLAANQPEYQRRLSESVIGPNAERARSRINDLRRVLVSPVIEPTGVDLPDWLQDEYRVFWAAVIRKYAHTVVLAEGWELSNGCAYEYLTAIRCSLTILDEHLRPVAPREGLRRLEVALKEWRSHGLNGEFLEGVIRDLRRITGEEPSFPVSGADGGLITVARGDHLLKDAVLDRVANTANVAQFVSFEAGWPTKQRHCRIHGFGPNHRFVDTREAIDALLARSPEHKVNVRAFKPEMPKGEPLEFGLMAVDDVLDVVKRKSREGKIAIVNETIDLCDGGVSGVALGDVVEFAPEDTPKCVDKPGVCRLPRKLALSVLGKVYGFFPSLDYEGRWRVEFSLHPLRRGFLHAHTVVWEMEYVDVAVHSPGVFWPNRFSRFLGDKVFGLLIADSLGFPVPRSSVLARKVPPFSFGKTTGSGECWFRTCPFERVPGYYGTSFGWQDPFAAVWEEEQKPSDGPGPHIASVLIQEGVEPRYSGGCYHPSKEEPLVEGVTGRGDSFMLGISQRSQIPTEVRDQVTVLAKHVRARIGGVEFEWVHDGERVWLVQLHRAKSQTKDTYEDGAIVFDGTPTEYVVFQARSGLEAFRQLLSEVKGTTKGIRIVGGVGLTSHFGDLLRSARVPATIVPD